MKTAMRNMLDWCNTQDDKIPIDRIKLRTEIARLLLEEQNQLKNAYMADNGSYRNKGWRETEFWAYYSKTYNNSIKNNL